MFILLYLEFDVKIEIDIFCFQNFNNFFNLIILNFVDTFFW